MRYAPEIYAKAFLDVAQKHGASTEQQLAARLHHIVAKNGDLPRMDVILSAIGRESVKRAGGRMVMIEVARESAEKEASRISSVFKKPDHVETRVNPELIAGTRIIINGEQELDHSLRGKLKKLFR